MIRFADSKGKFLCKKIKGVISMWKYQMQIDLKKIHNN